MFSSTVTKTKTNTLPRKEKRDVEKNFRGEENLKLYCGDESSESVI